MRLASWIKAKSAQVDLFTGDALSDVAEKADRASASAPPPALHGAPLMLPINLLCEDPNNPRTEFPEAEIEVLAEDIRQHGILQPIVVHPADARGRHHIHFGAKRWRAARLAGLTEVPVVVRDAPTDPYTQVAENQKRHGLTPLDLARFIKTRIDAGDSNATVAMRLSMNLTSVAHHLTLLDLPPMLDAAMHAGRCTSPRTLHELSKLHEQQPEQVKALVSRPGGITREAVGTLRARVESSAASPSTKLVAQAVAACDRLEKLLGRIDPVAPDALHADLTILRAKVAALSSWSPRGSDGQTP